MAETEGALRQFLADAEASLADDDPQSVVRLEGMIASKALELAQLERVSPGLDWFSSREPCQHSPQYYSATGARDQAEGVLR